MSTPICEDEGILQEWAPESRLLLQIPTKAQKGLFPHDLKLTCVDVVSDYIALGTNCGLVYWYCRKSAELQRLRLENTNSSITCVKIVSTVDYMVAAGTEKSNVTVFQIPKPPPESLPEDLKPKDKQVQRFTINGLHKSMITCLEWSQNGMKLFSGDKTGTVVHTAIDFNMHLSKSSELLNEQFEVVQLSYNQNTLLVSTVFRTIICDGTSNWSVTQLGSKERKILGKYGATFCKFGHGTVIYASRPGHRLWLADRSGNVEQTLIFKNAVQSSHPKIGLINPAPRKHPTDLNFGKLLQFDESRIICYQSDVLYVLHPGAISVVASLAGYHNILDVAVGKDEFFILEGDRSLVRIAHAPDPLAIELPEDKTSKRRSFIFDDFANRIMDSAVGSLKRMTSDFMPPVEKESPPELGDEALNLPPIVSLPVGMARPLEVIEFRETMEEPVIFPPEVGAGATGALSRQAGPSLMSASWAPRSSRLPEEDLVIRPGKRRKRRLNHHLINQGAESESDSISTASDDRLVCGVANEPSASEDSPISWSQSQSSFSILRDIHSLIPPPKRLDALKTPDDRSHASHASLDTCESVSENMALTPDFFREEQDRIFGRLANQDGGLLDSELTENMSISVNMTPSSSASSKLSDNLLSSEQSENVSMAEWEPEPQAAATLEQPQSADTSSVSSGNSQNAQKEKQVAETMKKWNKELVLQQLLKLDIADPLNESPLNFDTTQSYHDFPTPLVDSGGFDPNLAENSGKPINFEASYLLASEKHDREKCSEGPAVDENVAIECEVKKGSDEAKANENVAAENASWQQNPLAPFSTDVDENGDRGDLLWQEKPHVSFSSEVDVDAGKKLASLDSLSYGPPSGSSMLSSCHPSLDLNSGPTVLSNPHALVVEMSDRWLQYKTPDNIISLSLSNNYVVCTDNQGRAFYSQLSGIALTWVRLDYRASSVVVSMDAKNVWFVDNQDVYGLVSPSSNGPFSEDIAELDKEVRSVSIDGNTAYLVSSAGQIMCRKNLDKIPSGTAHIPCPWFVTRVFCRNDVLLAVTSDGQLIRRAAGAWEFSLVDTPNKTVSCLAVGPDDLVWVVDELNSIYFSDNLSVLQPHWWQVLISEYIFQNSVSTFLSMHNRVKMGNLRSNLQIKQTMVAANDSSVWVYNKHSSCVHVNKVDFTGHRWDEISIKNVIKWILVSVTGVFEEKGQIWVLSAQKDLFCATPTAPSYLKSVPSPAPEDLICVSSAPDTLWTLTSAGDIYARMGLSDDNPTGTSWRKLDLPQYMEIPLVWISCGYDSAWSVDQSGAVFITLVPPQHVAQSLFNAAWTPVDGKPKDDSRFVKIFAGPQMHIVWALDNKRQIYVREGVLPDHQCGLGWVHVGGIEATALTVSSMTVWAATPSGAVYRRYGISESNYIGDYWRRVPGEVSTLSATFGDEIWAVRANGSLTRLCQKRVLLQKEEKEKRNVSLGDNDDWLVVD